MTTTSLALTRQAAYRAALAQLIAAKAAANCAVGASIRGEISSAEYYRAQDALAETREACRLAAIEASIDEQLHDDNIRKACRTA